MWNQVAAKSLAKFSCGRLDAKYIQTNVTNILATIYFQVTIGVCNKQNNKI